MKKNYRDIIIVALLILNIFTLFKLNTLGNSIEVRMQQDENAVSNLENNINDIYANVDTMLKKQASILDNYDITFGDQLNADNLTVPVTIRVTPKEYSKDLTATLQLNNQNISMQKSGTFFIISTDAYVFDSFQPVVILENNGVRKIETIEEYYDLQYKYILNINGIFCGNEKYSSGSYIYNGEINLDFGNLQNNSPQKVSIIKELNGTIIDEHEIDLPDSMIVPLDDKIDMSSNDKFSLYINVQDNYGINYKYIVLMYKIDSKGKPVESRAEWTNGSIAEISDNKGNILFVPEYAVKQ